MLTLHEAIEQVIKKHGRPMTAVEIAEILNTTMPLYKRGDGSEIPSSQIGLRVKNYPRWFTKEGKLIGLYHGNTRATPKEVPAYKTAVKLDRNIMAVKDTSLAGKVLMNEKNFRPVASIDGQVPMQPGMYALRIKNKGALPQSYATELATRKHNLLYIGIASQSLQKRMLGQELRAKGHGTFFRSMGALLGYLPPKGSLVGKVNTRNYTFALDDERKIISWINENLLVNWIVMEDGYDRLEGELIAQHKPLMNIAKNPYAMTELSEARRSCVEWANKL